MVRDRGLEEDGKCFELVQHRQTGNYCLGEKYPSLGISMSSKEVIASTDRRSLGNARKTMSHWWRTRKQGANPPRNALGKNQFAYRARAGCDSMGKGICTSGSNFSDSDFVTVRSSICIQGVEVPR
jgi:hypothetical protein